MAAHDVPEYKLQDIERIAHDFLAKYWDPSERWVDIETIIERDMGLLIDYSAIDSFHAIGGVARRTSDDRLVILVSEELADRDPNRYRFTLAQELSHLLLHREILDAIRTPGQALDFHNSLTPEQYRHLESDANRCAGAILMPQRQFKDAAHDAYELWFARITATVGKLDPDFFLKRVIDELAKLYQVSAQAARIRLQSWPIRLYQDILESARKHQPSIAPGWS